VKTGNTPVANVIVTWFEDFNNADSDVPGAGKQCETNNQGQCSITATESNQADNDEAGFYACVNFQIGGGTCSDDTIIEWHNANSTDARNISVAPVNATQPSGGSQDLVATVTDRHNNPVPNACVGWDETGAGHFANVDNLVCSVNPNGPGQDGSYGTTCLTGANGTCQVEVISQAPETGDESITATLDTANYTTNGPNTVECSAPAGRTFAYGTPNTTTPPGDESDGAAAGNCTATSTVTWTNQPVTTHRVHVNLKLSCFSNHKHKVTCVASLSKPISGLTIVLHDGHGRVVGTAVSNSSGKARFHLHGLKRHKHKTYRAHAKKSARTFSADSNIAHVTVR